MDKPLRKETEKDRSRLADLDDVAGEPVRLRAEKNKFEEDQEEAELHRVRGGSSVLVGMCVCRLGHTRLFLVLLLVARPRSWPWGV